MAKNICLKGLNIQKVNKFLELLHQHKIKISKAIIFGSYAKGTANADSDIDIAIVSSRFGRNNIKEMFSLREIALKVDSHIEPIPLSPKDFRDHYSTLIQEIKQYGFEIG